MAATLRTLATHAAAGAMAAALACASPALAGPEAFDRQVGQAKAAMMADPEAALRHARTALAEAAGPGAEAAVRTATAQWLQGEALMRLNRLDEAAPIIQAGLGVAAARAPNTKLHGDLTMAQGTVFAIQGKVQPALQSYQAALRIFTAAAERRSQAVALQKIGSIYQDAGDYPKVLRYYAQSAELYAEDPMLLVSAHNNVGIALRGQGKFAEAAEELRKSLAIARDAKSLFLQAHVLGNLASVETQAGHYAQAQAYLDEGLRISEQDPAGREWRPQLWGVAAQIAQKQGRTAEAAQLLERTFEGVDPKTSPLPLREFHQTAYEVHSALGDARKALVHLEAYKRLDDEAHALTASTNAALMAAQFDFANQASRIDRLKSVQLQRDIELARTRNAVTLVLLAGSGLLAAVLLAAFLYIRRSRNEVRAANGQLNVLNITLEKALSARTEFLATTSHEIRTPLNGILGMTEVLMRERGLDPATREKIAVVHGAGETMRALVDDILDVAKIETGKLEIHPIEMNLPRLLEETAQLWREKAQAKGVALVLDIAGAPGAIVEDPTRLRQVLFNLMSNAIKFTAEGAVTVTAKVEALEEGDQLLLAVRDTGIGIPADRLNDIFESFTQVDGSVSRVYGGTGLGLSICRSLAAAMGGGIVVASTVGEGSSFEVRLPLTRAEGGVEAVVQAVTAQVFEESRLLLVDANPLSQSLLKAVLAPKVRGFETAGRLDEALPKGGEGYDLVLADAAALADNPDDGPLGAKALAEAVAPAALVVMASGLSDHAATAYLRAGAAQLVRKPIAAPALVAELKAGFDGRLSQAAGRASTG